MQSLYGVSLELNERYENCKLYGEAESVARMALAIGELVNSCVNRQRNKTIRRK